MDAANVNSLESEKKNEESLSYHSPNMSSEWQMNSTGIENPSMGLISQGNLMANSSSCSGVPMVDSFCSTIWDQPSNSQNLAFGDMNVRQNASSSQSFGMSWNPSNVMLKGGMFLPNVPGVLPQIPADSGFIERAARFSSFSGGNFSDMLNPFTIPEPMNPYFRGVAQIQRPQEMNMAPISKDVSLPDGHGATEVSPFKNDKKNDSLAGPSELESEDAGCSGRGGQEELEGGGGESSAKGPAGSRKRKSIGQDVDVDENKGAPEPSTEVTKNQNPASTTTKLGGKHGTQGPQTSDPTKEDYIHVRARRGQATNSHSLAERVRREKISERMKFLQDLVPGCNKVTGKAVMLDEIINYVQSLQRQVEFLSMKLATVNPRLNFNIESLLTKDILQSRAGPSSSLAFPPDMNMHYPVLHPSPTGLMHAGLSGLESSSDALRRSMCSQFTNMAGGGYKEATSQVPTAWEDELHNVVQMGLNSISPLGSQDLSASLPPGHMKTEQ